MRTIVIHQNYRPSLRREKKFKKGMGAVGRVEVNKKRKKGEKRRENENLDIKTQHYVSGYVIRRKLKRIKTDLILWLYWVV